MTAVVKTSVWDGLNPHLIASFFEVDNQGNRLNQDLTVKAPIIDGNFEATLNWQSAFEHSGAETKFPTLSAGFQSGAAQQELTSAGGYVDSTANSAKNIFRKFTGTEVLDKSGKVIPVTGGIGAKKAVGSLLSNVNGKSGITKYNSMQVFTGMPPIKIPITILLRAWADANKEVESPFDQLMQWALPVKLADGGFLTRVAKGGIANALYPTTVPTMIGMIYKTRFYSPLVIESIGYPITSPIDKNGKFVELSVQITLATLTAIDRDDWADINAGGDGFSHIIR
ncbi:MAG: hypothetical protein QM500_16380 [Methylococcales bacterium]